MSSTNRSNAREKHVADYYVTPVEDIEIFLNELIRLEPAIFSGKILDCCAGGDEQHLMSYPDALCTFYSKDIDTIDIREDSRAKIKNNYLHVNCKNEYDVIITNPPFNTAMEIINKAFCDIKDGGFVIMLLRLNFFESKARLSFWQGNMPKYVYVNHKRMSFTDDGKTDSIAHAHFVWQKGYKTEFCRLKVI